MMPIGPLMIEHRLIERMLAQMAEALRKIEAAGKVDTVFVDTAVDFIRSYADRCHHGKEEDILFRELAARDLDADQRRRMEELVEEHVQARRAVGELVAANRRYRNGEAAALEEIARRMRWLVEFYPVHIRKEDKEFFIPVMKVFSKDEKDAMLQEFWEFDRKMIHEKYARLVESLETRETPLAGGGV